MVWVKFLFLLQVGLQFSWAKTVPNSEVVYLNLLSARDDSDIRRVELTAFGNVYNFKFERAPLPVSPNFFVKTYSTGSDGRMTEKDYKPNLNQMANEIYHDPETGASVRLVDTDNGIQLEGILSDELVIAPMSSEVAEDGGYYAHKVSKIEKLKAESIPFYADHIPGHNGSDSADEMGRQSSSCAIVEVLAVADYAHQSYFGSDDDVTWYHVRFVNAMNLRYAPLSNPQVAVVTVGVVRNSDRNSQPYIENNLRENGKVVTTQALSDFRVYYDENKKDLKYDVALLLTGLDLAGESNGQLYKGVGGVAYVRSACGWKYGMSEDTAGAYNGVPLQTHELGHLLGSDHDGSGDGSSCSSNGGYIMAGDGGNNNQFSSCSKSQFQKYIGSSSGDCMRSWQAAQVYKDDRLPGETVSRQTRCERMHQDQAGISSFRPSNAEPCKMYCRTPADSNGRYYYWTHEDADGQECGSDQFCWLGGCRKKQQIPWTC